MVYTRSLFLYNVFIRENGYSDQKIKFSAEVHGEVLLAHFPINKVLKWEKISGFYHLVIWATLFGTTIHNL